VNVSTVSNSNGNLLTFRLNMVIEFGTAVYRFVGYVRLSLQQDATRDQT